MGFLKKTLKGAIVAKVASEARKPHNQAKAKALLGSLRNRVSGQKATPPTGRGTTATRAGSPTTSRAGKGTSHPR